MSASSEHDDAAAAGGARLTHRPAPSMDVQTAAPPSVVSFDAARSLRREVTPIARHAARRGGGDGREPSAAVRAMRARIQSARVRDDAAAEAEANRRLARALASKGVALDEAIAAGRRALALRGDDPELRRELAELLSSVGEPGLAAAMLRPVVDERCARAKAGDAAATAGAVDDLLTLGDLALRGGDVEGALESYRYVAVVAPDRPEGQERVARTRAIAPHAVTSEVAARAYIAAAKKHQIAGRDPESLEALARAFEADPSGPLAATVLADALDELGRHAAADAVRSEHAEAVLGNGGVLRAANVHEHRRTLARARDDRPSLLSAALAELVDLVVQVVPADRGLHLARIGVALADFPALRAAIRHFRAISAPAEERIEAVASIASSSQSSLEEQLEALAEQIELSPTDEAPLALLRERAMAQPTTDKSTLDALVDALVRSLMRSERTAETRPAVVARAAELAAWADERLGDAALAKWAWEQLLAVAPDDSRANQEITRLSRRLEIAGDAVTHAREALAAAGDSVTRAAAARRLVEVLLHRPPHTAALTEALDLLIREAPFEPQTLVLLRRARPRLPIPALDELLGKLARTSGLPARAARVMRAEVAIRLRDADAARRLLEDEEHAKTPEVAHARIALELLLGDGARLGAALGCLPLDAPKERTALLAAAARAARLGGATAQARNFAEDAMRRDSRDVRGAYELAELSLVQAAAIPAALAGAAIERALAGIGARARWALALATLTEEASELALAAAWTRRAWALRPGDLGIARLWLRRAAALGDAELLGEVIETTTRALPAMAPLADDLANALEAAWTLDRQVGEKAQRALVANGAVRIRPLREVMLAVTANDVTAWCALQERWLASGAAAAERPSVLLAVAQARRAIDPSGAAEAASRVLAESDSSSSHRSEARKTLLELAGAALEGDAQIAVGEAVAQRALRELMARMEGPRARLDDQGLEIAQSVADVMRTLGRDLWDLAEDTDGAMRVWLRGAVLLGGVGLDRLEADLDAFGDDGSARDALLELARRGDQLHGLASSAPLEVLVESFRARAWERVLHRPPGWIEPVSLAREAAASAPDPASLIPAFESLARRMERADILNDLFEISGGRVAGRFGERGLRYRAARVLDRLGRSEEALDQAVRAFAAVPGEGALTVLLERLAKSVGKLDTAVSALVDAAEQSDDESKRALWLDRAAALAREAFPDPVDRVDLTLRLFLTAPSARTASSVVEGIREVIALDGGSGAESWVKRLLRAHKRVDGKLGYVDRLPVLAVVAQAVADLWSVSDALDLVAKGARSTPISDMDPLRVVGESIGAISPEAALAWLDEHEGGGVARAHIAWGAGNADRAIKLLVETAPELDEFDFQSDSSEGNKREIALLDLWSKGAKDSEGLAAARARFGVSTGPSGDRASAAKAIEELRWDDAASSILAAWQSRAQLDEEGRAELVAQARKALPALGRHAELASMLAADLEGRSGAEAAERWREISTIRSTELEDPRGALEALMEAGRCTPGDEALWSEIELLAEKQGAPDRLAAALSHLLPSARPERRVQLLRKLARVLEHDLGRDVEAAERWAELVQLVPVDAEAADALERIAERRGDRRALVELLRARASRLPVGHAERIRALRAIARELSGQPGRRGEVLGALREVHQQNPADLDVALQLADVARAAGDLATAAEAFQRALRVTPPSTSRTQLAIECARVLLELHDRDGAARVLADPTLVPAPGAAATDASPHALDVLRMRLDIAIARGDAREEALTRIRLAEIDVGAPPQRRAANCAAAAKTLLAMGERDRARELAWTAARVAPGDPANTALLAELEFTGARVREQGKTTPLDAELLALLSQVAPSANAPPEMLAIIAFARAELIDAAQGGGAGYRQLHGWPEVVRNQPLVQLALAERLADEWSFGPAAIAYERAFSGDLRSFRRPGPTALRAADVAARAADAPRARAFLELAARDPACRVDARRHAVDLARTLGDRDGALRALERLAAESTGAVRAEALSEQARMLRADDPERAVDVMSLAIAALDAADPLRIELRKELEQLQAARHAEPLPPAPPPSLRDSGRLSRPSVPPDRAISSPLPEAPRGERQPPSDPPQGTGQAATRRWLSAHGTSEPPPEHPRTAVDSDTSLTIGKPAAPPALEAPLEDALTDQPRMTMVGAPPEAMSVPTLPRPATTDASPIDLATLQRIADDGSAPAAERVRAWKTLGEAAHEAGREDDAARCFIAALELGDVPAGDLAAEILDASASRAGDLLLVRRRQAFLLPGSRPLLDGLYEAALKHRDLTFARAVDHVRRAFDPVAGPVPPPPLEAQLDRPDLIVPLLERRAAPQAAEALRLVWEHASHLFRRDISVFGLGPVERVQGAWHPLGKMVMAAERLLGATRTPVLVRSRPGRDVEAILTAPPSVLLGGDCREDSSDVRYLLGAGLVASLGSHCLLLAQGEASARATWSALVSAFGPPEFGRGVAPEIGRLAASLWQSIPRGAQRRLGELLNQSPPTFDVALTGARQVARRGGLYLSGDIAAAVRSTLAETGDRNLGVHDPSELPQICAEHPEVADLLRLALSPEFAEARWRAIAAPGGRRSPSSGGMASAGG